jgi:hypothetical protein
MTHAEDENIHRTLERVAKGSMTDRELAGFLPLPRIAKRCVNEMPDPELIHAILGVPT